MCAREQISREIGIQLKNIRSHFKMTMDEIGKDTGTSRSYLSDFERGFRLPTTKYLRYLHNKLNVNLNYVFKGEGWMFRPTPEERPPDFGQLQDQVTDLLNFIEEMPHALYAVLGFITEYKLMNKELIDRHINEKNKILEKKTPD
jgi:transcriptional regulator with XRE-family HTH domain